MREEIFAARKIPQEIFRLCLGDNAAPTASIVPARATGSGTPTFTRATIGTIVDWEGVVRTVKSGEVRFQGCRRVENIINGSSEDLSGWTKNATATVTGTNQVNLPAEGDNVIIYNSAITAMPANCKGIGSMVLSGSGTTTLYIAGSGGVYETFKQVITLTSTPTRYAIAATFANASHTQFGIGVLRDTGNTATQVIATMALLELTHGQANQNPSEYVSKGVRAAPYYGAGVDGVCYFTYKNGNSLSGGVVTEALGLPISTNTGATTFSNDATGPHGLVREDVRTNILQYSETFDAGNWASSATGSVVKDVTGPDGIPNSGTTVTWTNAADTRRQNGTKTAGATLHHIQFLKQGNTQYTSVQSSLSGGTAKDGYGLVNWSGGPSIAAGGVDAANVTASIRAVGSGWYRVDIKHVDTGGNTAFRHSFFPNTDGNATSVSTGTVIAWGADVADCSVTSSEQHSYIPSLAASTFTRNEDQLTYPMTGNYSGTAGSVAASYRHWDSVSTGPRVLGDTASGKAFYTYRGFNAGIYDEGGDNVQSSGGFAGYGTRINGAASWGPAGISVYANAGGYSHAAYAGSMSFTNLSVGGQGGSNGCLNGCISRLSIFGSQLSDGVIPALAIAP